MVTNDTVKTSAYAILITLRRLIPKQKKKKRFWTGGIFNQPLFLRESKSNSLKFSSRTGCCDFPMGFENYKEMSWAVNENNVFGSGRYAIT